MDSQHHNGQPVTHYQVLNLTPALLDEQQDPSALVKRAYHRALLRNHPDKATATSPSPSSPSSPTPFSIDQITTAFTVLSSPAQRATYNTSLRIQQAGDAVDAATGNSTKFQTGVENVDLDDLDFSEAGGYWYRSCRCGNDKGYLFTEDDLVAAEDEGGGELLLGCLDCSLWLRVHFAVLDDDDEDQALDEPTSKRESS